MGKRNSIDFLGIGAQKSGTTWLYRNLSQIPEFTLPPVKEFHYFDRSSEYESFSALAETKLINRIKQKGYLSTALKRILRAIKKRNWRSARFFIKWSFFNYSDNYYHSLFRGYKGYTGEITPGYAILEKRDILRIYKLEPNLKLVLLVRNPVERAWSAYKFVNRKNFNLERIRTVDIIEYMESRGQTLRSNYMRTIDNYLSVFPQEQILLGFYDAIKDNPNALMSDVIKHICGDENISISHLDLNKVIHKSPIADCPKEVEAYLKARYHDQIKALSEKYGGYFSKWYQDTYEVTLEGNTKIYPSTMYLEEKNEKYENFNRAWIKKEG